MFLTFFPVVNFRIVFIDKGFSSVCFISFISFIQIQNSNKQTKYQKCYGKYYLQQIFPVEGIPVFKCLENKPCKKGQLRNQASCYKCKINRIKAQMACFKKVRYALLFCFCKIKTILKVIFVATAHYPPIRTEP